MPIFSDDIYSFSHGSASAISLCWFNVSLHMKHFGRINRREWKILFQMEALLAMKVFLLSFVFIVIPLGHPFPLYWIWQTFCSFILIRFNKYLVASSVCCEEQVNPIMNTLWPYLSQIDFMALVWQGKAKQASVPFISFWWDLTNPIKSISW